jgi:hypothetical protein
MLETVALDEPHKIGDELEFLGRRYVITGEMSRADFVADQNRRRAMDRRHGRPKARAGVYTVATREFVPGYEVPRECEFCYRVRPA